ncbi:MAG: hypothetical protein JWP81_4276 [Ferruginibacter sp.]|nr:hypothetical protein [Ferruginibacter sp.]
MKKVIVSFVLFVTVCISAFAQNEVQENKFSFNAGPELGFATGSFSGTHSVGFGGSAQAEYFVIDKLKATATIGLLTYVGKSYISSTNYAALRIIPLRLGAKYFLFKGLYGGAQMGVAFLGNFEPYNGTAFAYSPLMLGYEFTTKSNKSIDATIKYDAYTGTGAGTIGSFGIRLAYVF